MRGINKGFPVQKIEVPKRPAGRKGVSLLCRERECVCVSVMVMTRDDDRPLALRTKDGEERIVCFMYVMLRREKKKNEHQPKLPLLSLVPPTPFSP